MRVLIITQWFDPEPVPKGLSFAQEIAARGHEVEVITGFPNYPGGKVYPGFRIKPLLREQHGAVKVNRVALYPSHDSGAVGRVLNYASFGMSSFLCGLLLTRRPDVIYCYHPPLTSGIAAALVSMIRRVPLVYDIQDLWPDTLEATGMIREKWLLRGVGRLCSVVYKAATALVVLSPGFKVRLIERGVEAKKVSVIYNWCDEQKILDVKTARAPEEMVGRFNVVFAGTMGRAQALGPVLDAARLVGEKNTRVQFVFVGGGLEVESLKAWATRHGQSNVLFLPSRPMNEIGAVLSAADCLLVHLRDDPLFEITIPSKTQAYMAIGRPVLMAVRGDAAELIQLSGAGIVAEPEDPESIAAAVLQLSALPAGELSAMGVRGRRYYQEFLGLKQGVTRFIEVFQQATRGK